MESRDIASNFLNAHSCYGKDKLQDKLVLISYVGGIGKHLHTTDIYETILKDCEDHIKNELRFKINTVDADGEPVANKVFLNHDSKLCPNVVELTIAGQTVFLNQEQADELSDALCDVTIRMNRLKEEKEEEDSLTASNHYDRNGYPIY